MNTRIAVSMLVLLLAVLAVGPAASAVPAGAVSAATEVTAPDVASTTLGPEVPFKVFITELWQCDDGVDPGLGLIGDYYAKVTINGVAQDNDGACDDSGSTGIIVPFQLFKNFHKISDCSARTPWVFSRMVPAGQPVTVRIQVFDSDTAFDDEADLKPGSGNAVEFTVDPATGQWHGGDADADFNWPQTCSRPGLNIGGNNANACWQAGVDTDDDGLLDIWETSGVDTDNDSVIDVDLAALGASPQRMDVFVEADFVDAANHSHRPTQSAIALVVRSFANAPVANPDGTTGIQLHVDTGALYGAGTVVPLAGAGGVTGTYGDLGGGGSAIPEAGNETIDAFGNAPGGSTPFEDLKEANFNALRDYLFRYMIFGHQTNARRPANDCTSGVASRTHRDFLVTLGGVDGDGTPCWDIDISGSSVGNTGDQAGTFMHELGHALGLGHGGGDGVNDKPNYLSVMNYTFQGCGVPTVDTRLPGGCDYSRLINGSLLPPLDEIDLDECVGIGGGLPFGPMDWNGNGIFEGVSQCGPVFSNTDADVNNDGVCVSPGSNDILDTNATGDDAENEGGINDGNNRACNTTASGDDVQVTAVGFTPTQPQTLNSFDDWNGLVGSLIDFSSSSSSGAEPEADSKRIRQARQYLAATVAPNVTIDQTGPATGAPGDVLTYTVHVENTGLGPAVAATLEETTPDGASHATDLGAFAAGAAATQSTTFTVPDDACPGDLTGGGGATVSFKDFVGNPLSATDSVPLEVLDVEAPMVDIVMTPGVLWPPNHQFVEVTATITITDNCDPDPAVTLVEITSNEPDRDFIGQGDQGPDVDGAALGSDDRVFSLRSERKTGIGRPGRIYTITYRVTDVSGNSTVASATVTVPTSNRPFAIGHHVATSSGVRGQMMD